MLLLPWDEIEIDASDEAIFADVERQLAAQPAEPTAEAAAPVEEAEPAAPTDEAVAPAEPAAAVGSEAAAPAAPVQPTWDPKSVTSYESIVEALPSMPPPVRAAVEHIVGLLEPHYQAIIATENEAKATAEAAKAQHEAWNTLVADAKARGVEVVGAEQVKALQAKHNEQVQLISGYHTAYSRLTNDAFVATTPTFSATHPLARFFFAAVQQGEHVKEGTDADSEHRKMHLLWTKMVSSVGTPAAPAAPAATQAAPAQQPVKPSSHATLAATATRTRAAAPTMDTRDPSKMTEKEILDEADRLYAAMNLRS